jgi:hypothetical protein
MMKLLELVSQIREKYDAEDYDTALFIMESALKQSLDFEKEESGTCWELAELLFLLNKTEDAINLSIHIVETQNNVDSLVRCVEFMRMADHGESERKYSLKAVELSHDFIRKRGCPVVLGKSLIECALDGLGWQVIDDIEITNVEVQALIKNIKLRSVEFDLHDLDSRRYAYIVEGITVLGLSEDNGDRIQPYWFLNADVYEIAWFVRRLVMLVKHQELKPSAVLVGDSNAQPIAIALANQLKLPILDTPSDKPRVLRIFSAMEDFTTIPPALSKDFLTVCFAVNLTSGWLHQKDINLVDVIGIVTPANLDWNDLIDNELDSFPQFKGNQPISSEMAEKLADILLKEVNILPADKASVDIFRFYEKYLPKYREVD